MNFDSAYHSAAVRRARVRRRDWEQGFIAGVIVLAFIQVLWLVVMS